MALNNSTGVPLAILQAINATSTTQQHPLGTRVWDTQGNNYVYLQGVASTVVGNFVTFNHNFATTRIAADAVGPVAVAKSACVANQFGWYQVYGINTEATTDTVAANKSCYIDNVVGRVDDAVVTGDLVVGCFTMTADTSNVATVSLNFPYVTDVLG